MSYSTRGAVNPSSIMLDSNNGNWVWRRLLGAGLLLSSFSLSAVVFQPMSIESLSRQADLVVQGTVLSKTCQADPAGRIYTRIELEVTDIWKGAASGDRFKIVHGGGVLGERESRVSGQVSYDIGEEVVAFLVRNQRGEGVTLGLMQGKFHVWKDPATGQKLVASPFRGAPEPIPSQAAPRTAVSSSSQETALRLADLKKRVREVQP